jgi:hypothetical protein
MGEYRHRDCNLAIKCVSGKVRATRRLEVYEAVCMKRC